MLHTASGHTNGGRSTQVAVDHQADCHAVGVLRQTGCRKVLQPNARVDKTRLVSRENERLVGVSRHIDVGIGPRVSDGGSQHGGTRRLG